MTVHTYSSKLTPNDSESRPREAQGGDDMACVLPDAPTLSRGRLPELVDRYQRPRRGTKKHIGHCEG
eukprot:4876657-Pleurochrysis_carterae.AAC.3